MSDWLRYEWEWERQPAVFRVDLQYWELLPTLAYSHLIYIACAPKNPRAASFSRAEERCFSALSNALSETLQKSALYVGTVELNALRQLYFYTSDPSLIKVASALCRAEQKLSITCGQVEETDYVTYYTFLFPDDAKLQSVENASFIQEVARHNGDVDLVRRITMMMTFPTFEGREAYLKHLPKTGLVAGVSETIRHPSHPFCVTVHGYSTLHLMDLNRCTARAIRSAAVYDGMLERLDADFIERH